MNSDPDTDSPDHRSPRPAISGDLSNSEGVLAGPGLVKTHNAQPADET
ncbi:MAG: hypothetical protein KJZ87_01760 [Thermoguttaceae bacterium]|nr:hypothetical protein [Thermoguttaceae bacterium]